MTCPGPRPGPQHLPRPQLQCPPLPVGNSQGPGLGRGWSPWGNWVSPAGWRGQCNLGGRPRRACGSVSSPRLCRAPSSGGLG